MSSEKHKNVAEVYIRTRSQSHKNWIDIERYSGEMVRRHVTNKKWDRKTINASIPRVSTGNNNK